MNQDVMKEALFSGIWGTCGPWEDRSAALISASLGEGWHTVLTYSGAAAKKVFQIYERMGYPYPPKDLVKILRIVYTSNHRSSESYHPENETDNDSYQNQPAEICGAICTTDPKLYEIFYAIHHCGHKPGISATVDLSSETVLGGDMRISEWQAIQIYENEGGYYVEQL